MLRDTSQEQEQNAIPKIYPAFKNILSSIVMYLDNVFHSNVNVTSWNKYQIYSFCYGYV